MSGLKDQLLKAGLVNEKQVKKAQMEKRKEDRQKQAPQKAAEAEAEQRRRQQALADKAEKDRLFNLRLKEEADRKALAAQIRQMIETHRLPRSDWENPQSDTPYNFSDRGVVKRLRLSDSARGQVMRGQLAIVELDKRYELVPTETAEKIRQRNAASVIVLNTPSQTDAPDTSGDPYAAYLVPDDLMW